MMGTTPNYGLPYPEADTLITDSAAIVQELAEKIDGLMIFTHPGQEQPPATTYSVGPYLVEHIKTSGTWTPPADLGPVDLVIVSGGNNGNSSPGAAGGTGGAGGIVRVLRNVTMTGKPVPVVVGGPQTGTTFAGYKVLHFNPDPWEPGPYGEGGPSNTPGADGIELVTGGDSAWIAGGGGGGGSSNGFTVGNPGQPGGRAGGGVGGRGGYGSQAGNPDFRPTGGGSGAAGFGGGGGGGGGSSTNLIGGGAGGTGGVMVFAHTLPTRSARTVTPDPIDPAIYVALDAAGIMLGAYAVDPTDPQLPGVAHARLVPFPTDPVDTGRIEAVPMNVDDPDSPTTDTPIRAWPAAGWTYTDTDGWKEP